MLTDVLMDNRRFLLKSVNGCYACSKYSVSVFRQVVCITSVRVLVFELGTFLFIGFGACAVRFTSVGKFIHVIYICIFMVYNKIFRKIL